MNDADDLEIPPYSGLRPVVAPRAKSNGGLLIAAGAGALGVVVFLGLSHQRTLEAPSPTPRSPTSQSGVTAVSPPPELALMEAKARGASEMAQVAQPGAPTRLAAFGAPSLSPPPASSPTAVATAGAFLVPSDQDRMQRLKTPAVIVDFSAPDGSGGEHAPGAERSASASGQAGPSASRPGSGAKLSNDEQFAERVGAAEPDQARAGVLHNRTEIVPQGAVIPAVLETALNSDLPGFARAVVSRDVRGFDGSQVLIPRGSRLVGQYKSGVSQGQSRAFVIWTRLIRPDGASIQIGSPAADQLGRAGLDGQVDRHFFERFSGSILLSVVNSGVAALFRGPSTQIVIGSSQDASGLAATLAPPTAIPPTIKVAQGAPVRVFVARDLDFSDVGGAVK